MSSTNLPLGRLRLPARLALGAVVLASWMTGMAVAAPIIGPELSRSGASDVGELLIGELNCIACHTADEKVQQRLGSRMAPVLDEVGSRASIQELRAWISDPHREKPGTTMPQLLHRLPAEERAEAVEDLVQYLAAQRGAEDPKVQTYDLLTAAQGRDLYHKVGCVACHMPHEPAGAFNPAADDQGARPEAFAATSVPLGNLARKYSVSSLANFLLDPLKARPSGRMPSLMLTPQEANAVAMYLLREQAAGPDGQGPQRIPGLAYAYSEATMSDNPNFDELPATASGSVAGPILTPARRKEHFAIRFTGFVRIDKPGKYTFYARSDDGSRLMIGDKVVVENWGLHAAQERQGEIQLGAGEHPIRILYYQGVADQSLTISYAGPGIKKQEVPHALFSHDARPMLPVGRGAFAAEPARIERGRARFIGLGCASCHALPGGEGRSGIPSKTFAELAKAPEKGCLAEQPPTTAANYALSEQQRSFIQSALAKSAELSEPLAPAAAVGRAMTSFNCYACHSRDGAGGGVSSRLEYFVPLVDPEIGDEGRIPPHLTAVGAKLTHEWMQAVMLNGGLARPYMATRMPQFGELNVGHLPELFAKADVVENARTAPVVGQRETKLGRALVGTDGLSCVSCHTFGQFKSLGIPAVDLARVTQRLKYDWFHRYLIDPQSLRPGTRMPSFWPDGKAVNDDVLGGNTDAQIGAIWAYLAGGMEADPPAGLIQGKREIVATDRPVIYRNFIAGAGVRAIGIGYPEKVNLAFDANDLRLALVWHGAFIDSARHSSGRGEGFEPPLGNNVIQLPEGPSVAALSDLQAAWPQRARDVGGYEFHGYRLDKEMRPSFRYSLGGAQVEEFFEPIPGDIDPALIRRFRVSGERPGNLYVRLGAAQEISRAASGGWVLDKRLQLRVTGVEAVMREINGRTEILVPIAGSGELTFSVQTAW